MLQLFFDKLLNIKYVPYFMHFHNYNSSNFEEWDKNIETNIEQGKLNLFNHLDSLSYYFTWAFKFSGYLFAAEERRYFGYISAYHIDTFQKHGNLTAHSQHKTSYLYWMNCWHANRWKEDIDWNVWIEKQAQCFFILKFQSINYKYWTGFHHTSHS